MSYGLFVSNSGKLDDDLDYDSRKSKTQMSLKKAPAHVGIITTKGGSSITMTTAGKAPDQIVYTIEHGLGYVPECFVYFDVTSTPAGMEGFNDYFYYQIFPYGSGLVYETVTFKVDNKNLYIIHTMEEYIDTPVTSTLDLLTFNIKYMIFSVDSKTDSYTGGITHYI